MILAVASLESAQTKGFERRIAFTIAATIFLAAFLLFQVELIISDYVLPWFGGSAAVWTTTMLVFQTLLFAGYAYAHWIATHGLRRQRKVHFAMLGFSVLAVALNALKWPSPITPGPSWQPSNPEHPFTSLTVILAVSVGLPFFLLSSTGPLVQYWYTRATDRAPYRLYAISNVGSLLGLLSYPFLVQPVLKLRTRGWTWSGLYLAYAAGIALCGIMVGLRTANAPATVTKPSSRARVSPVDRFFWIALPACASLALLAGTGMISLYLVSVPLIWVVPLALYLLSFIICFGRKSWYVRGLFQVLFGVSAMGLILAIGSTNVWFELGSCLVLLFVVCMICHGELVRLAPLPEQVTSFYLWISAGGALGSIFAGIIAPLLFSRMWEFQFSVISVAVLSAVVTYRDTRSWLHSSSVALIGSSAIVLFGMPLLGRGLSGQIANAFAQMEYFRVANLLSVILLPLAAACLMKPGPKLSLALRCGIVVAVFTILTYSFAGIPWAKNGTTIARVRNFYGVLEVQQSAEDRVLMHGKTVHGSQWLAPRMRRFPTTYYGQGSGLGQLLAYHPKRDPVSPMRIGVVGMGAGTIAAYGAQGDLVRFYELNPAVVDLVRGKDAYFSFISDSPADIEVVVGDGRLSLERELKQSGPQNFDLLVLDAFNGDTIPVHLLTTEAVQTYLQHLAPNGVLAIHVSSTTLDLSPIISAVMDHFALHGAMTSMGDQENKVSSDWVLLSRDISVLRTEGLRKYGQPVDRGRKPLLWTDDYTNIAGLLYR